MNMKGTSIIRSAAIGIGVIGLISACSRISNDSRGAFMRLMEADLHTYSVDHAGWFPNADNEWSALAKLYPGSLSSG